MKYNKEQEEIDSFVREANRLLGDGTINKDNYEIDFARALRYIKQLTGENSRLKNENDKLKDRIHSGFGGNS
jgi:hypothetical protein